MRTAIAIPVGAAAIVGGLALFAGVTARRVEAAAPATGKFVTVAGERIHYRDLGAGPPLLLIHGLGAQMRSFAEELVEDLARDHRVILVDRPGAGYSTRALGSSATLSAQADAIAEFIGVLGVDRPVLVGHSLGGALALAVALNHPQAVGALALIAPLTQAVDDPPPVFKGLAIRSPAMRFAVAWTLAAPLGMLRSEGTLREVFRPDPVPAAYATDGGAPLGLRPASFYATSSDLVAVNDDLPDFVTRYPTLRIPVAILYGRDDNLLDPELHGARTAREIPGAEIDFVDGGHMLPFIAPQATARWIRAAAARKT